MPLRGFNWRLLGPGRTGLHAYLRPNLEELELTFPCPIGIFARGWAYCSAFRLSPEHTRMKGLGWIEELLQTTVKRIRLAEVGHNCNKWDWHSVDGQTTQKLDVPLESQRKFDAAGVELDIQVL
jgi:hypothetical protein